MIDEKRPTLVQLGFEHTGPDLRPLHFLEDNANLVRKFVLRSTTGDRSGPKHYSWRELGEAMNTEFGICNANTREPYSTKELSKKWSEIVRKLDIPEQVLAKCAAGPNDRLRWEAAIEAGPTVDAIKGLKIAVLSAISDLGRQLDRLCTATSDPTKPIGSPNMLLQEKKTVHTLPGNVGDLRLSARTLVNDIGSKHIELVGNSDGSIQVTSCREQNDALHHFAHCHNTAMKTCNFLMAEIPEISIEKRLQIYFRAASLEIKKGFKGELSDLLTRALQKCQIDKLAQSATQVPGNKSIQISAISVSIFVELLISVASIRRTSVL